MNHRKPQGVSIKLQTIASAPPSVSAGVCDILTYVRGLRLVLGVHQRAPVHKSQQVPEPHSLGVHHVQQSPPKLLPAGGAPHHHILQVLVWASGMVTCCALCLHVLRVVSQSYPTALTDSGPMGSGGAVSCRKRQLRRSR